MKLFQAHELMSVIVGNDNYDWDMFERTAKYKNGYTAQDLTVTISVPCTGCCKNHLNQQKTKQILCVIFFFILVVFQVRLFWEVFHDLTLEDKKNFLLFLTGCDRIPVSGMEAIEITMQPVRDDKLLPAAHTCFNLLDLPRYQTKEKLKYKLLQALEHRKGFGLV